MPTPALDLDDAAALLERGQRSSTAGSPYSTSAAASTRIETLAYDLAHATSALATRAVVFDYAARGDVEARLVAAFLAIALATSRRACWAANPPGAWMRIGSRRFASFVATYRDPAFLSSHRRDARSPPPRRGLRDGRPRPSIVSP